RGGIPMDPGMRKPDVDRIVDGEKNPTKIRLNYAKDILSRPMIAPAGTKFAYSNAGFTLLGVVAERVSGKAYETLVKDLVFKPLGLNHSYTGIDTLPEARPSGHVRQSGDLRAVNSAGPMEFMFAPAGGGMYMSLGDLVKFGRAHLDGLHGKDGLLKAS